MSRKALFRMGRRLTVAILVTTSVVACAPKQIALTEKADKLYQQADYDGAKKKYASAVKADPKYAPALVKLGQLSLRAENWQEARDYFSRAISSDASIPEAWLGRGLASIHLRAYEPAGEDYKKARALESEHADLGLGMYYFLTDRHDAALAALHNAAKVEADSDEAARYAFMAALAGGDFQGGLEVLSGAQPGDDPLLQTLHKRMMAELAYLAGDYAAARQFANSLEGLPHFGIWFRDPSPIAKERMGAYQGVVVEYVHLGGPAARAGMLPSDVITSFERKPVRSVRELEALIKSYLARTSRVEAQIEVLRGREQLAFRILPDDFKLRTAIDEAASGTRKVELHLAPSDWMMFP